MIDRSSIDSKSIKTKISEAVRRCASVGAITSVLLLAAPFVNVPRDQQEPTPRAVDRPQPTSRIGITLRNGDTLVSVLKSLGVKPPSAHAMLEKVRPLVNPRKIRSGDNFHVVLNPEDRSVEAMEFVVDDNLVRVKATGEGWLAERHEIPFVRESRVVRGTIKESLYQTGTDAGLSPQHILDLAKIFEYDVDFFSDFQPRDAFSVIVEELHYADGRRGTGQILAAELEADDDIFSAFYFVGKDGSGGFYNSKGEALRRSFLRAPLSYARISSPFTTNRLHPIFRTLRPHLAIDYAAPLAVRSWPLVADVSILLDGVTVTVMSSISATQEITRHATRIFLDLRRIFTEGSPSSLERLSDMSGRRATPPGPTCISNFCAARQRLIFSTFAFQIPNFWREKICRVSTACATSGKR